jgi:GntR family transcriptional regulator / MocR family aminotransferase
MALPTRKPTRQESARRRAASPPVLVLALTASGSRTLQRQVYDGLRDAILAGRFRPGTRLPSTRVLAAELGVSRNTVTAAFEQLRSEGYVCGRRGGGTRVRDALPDAMLIVRAPDTAQKPARLAIAPTRAAHMAHSHAAEEAPILSRAGARLFHQGSALIARAGSPPVPFRISGPATDEFPERLWAKLTARSLRAGFAHGYDAHPAGQLPLREAIASYLVNARGARCTRDQVMVVSGTQQALDLTARVLLDVDDAVWMEDPGYPGAQAVFSAAGARLVPVSIDADGLDVRAAELKAPNARLAYVTPSHQFPLGVVMSAPRRMALLAWARRTKAWIIEDDYDSEFRYSGRPLPCLQGLEAQHCGDAPSRVIYIGTFNKSLSSGVRVGYLVVPDALIDTMLAARAVMDRHAPTFVQGVLADFIGEGHYARHLRRLRAVHSARQQVLVDAVRDDLHGVLQLTPDSAGLHLIALLQNDLTDVAAAELCTQHGVETTPLSRFVLDPTAHVVPQALLLSYAGFNESAIRRAVGSMRAALLRT